MKKYIILIICFFSIFLSADPPNWQEITGTQYSMVVFARIVFNDSYFDNSGNNLAAAFGPDGINDCRDIAGWQSGNPGFWYFYIVGNQNGEEISFKIYDEASDHIYDCDQSIIFDDGETIGSLLNPIQLDITYILDAPRNVTLNIDANSNFVTLTWDAVAGAQSYYIYAGNNPEISIIPGTHVGHVSQTIWWDSLADRKYYTVVAVSHPIDD